MTSLVSNIPVHSVDDLYAQFARLAGAYSNDDNPLMGLTRIIPSSAEFFAIVAPSDDAMATTIMQRVSGRRKLRRITTTPQECGYRPFSQSGKITILYA